jgi:hypothetical protein
MQRRKNLLLPWRRRVFEKTDRLGKCSIKQPEIRDPSIIFRNNFGCFAQPVFHCNCAFARMNFNEMASLEATAQSGLVGLSTKPTLSLRMSAQEN